MHASPFAARQTWPFELRPLTPQLGAQVTALDLRRGLSPDVFDALYHAFVQYQVLLFPPQDLSSAAQVSFARMFGEVQVHVMSVYHADHRAGHHHPRRGGARVRRRDAFLRQVRRLRQAQRRVVRRCTVLGEVPVGSADQA